ncbi:MAG: hypothetical protein IKG52_08750 [Rhodobacteraceae bacterium]|nr:hypothetical protein [Paracoccaceae bacterium]
MTKTDLSSSRPLASSQDKRNRLVGPPPSFEVNVIQHLREALTDPATPDSEDANAQPETTEGKIQHEGYHILSQLSPNADDDTTMRVDVSL